MSLEEVAPTADVLLALEPDELGLRLLLPILARPSTMPGEPLSLQGFLGRKFALVHYGDGRVGTNSGYPAEHHRDLKDAIAEAWAWLVGQGLVVPRSNPTRRRSSNFTNQSSAQPKGAPPSPRAAARDSRAQTSEGGPAPADPRERLGTLSPREVQRRRLRGMKRSRFASETHSSLPAAVRGREADAGGLRARWRAVDRHGV